MPVNEVTTMPEQVGNRKQQKCSVAIGDFSLIQQTLSYSLLPSSVAKYFRRGPLPCRLGYATARLSRQRGAGLSAAALVTPLPGCHVSAVQG